MQLARATWEKKRWRHGSRRLQTLIFKARRVFLAGLLYAVLLSFCINLLQLTVPLYMLQVHDRVLNSRSHDTLLMLTVLAVGALLVLRHSRVHPGFVFPGDGQRACSPAKSADPHSCRAGIRRSGPSQSHAILARSYRIACFFDFLGGKRATGCGLVANLSCRALFLLHPGFRDHRCCARRSSLFVAAWLLIFLTRSLLKDANQANIEAISKIGATLRHAEAIEAMGMLPALARRWRWLQMNALDLLDLGGTRNRAMASIARTLRFIIQVATLGAGTLLAMEQAISPGAMIATSIIVGRLLMPFDHVVETWRQWVNAVGNWKRIQALLAQNLAVRQTMPTPRPHGDLIIDKLVYAAPGVEMPIIKGISFSLSPGEVLGIVGPSAAGKSTLARLMIGIVKPTSGGVFLMGTMSISGNVGHSERLPVICRNRWHCLKAPSRIISRAWATVIRTACSKRRGLLMFMK